MTEPRWPLAMGGCLRIDGETITVHTVDGSEVSGYTERGEPVRFVLTRVAEEPARLCNEEWRFGSVLLDAGALSGAQLRDAAELLAHLNEAWFGYRSGDPERPAPGEPRTIEQLDSQLSAADVTLDASLLDRIDEIVQPGVNLNPADTSYGEQALKPSLRRR